RIDQRLRVAADGVADVRDLVRRLARHLALAARGEEAELAIDLLQPFFHRAADRRRHAARVPVEPEDATERLEPERIGETPEDLVRALFGGQVDQDLARQPHHAAEQPGRSFTAVKWKGCEAGVTRHNEKGPSKLGPSTPLGAELASAPDICIDPAPPSSSCF